MSTTVNVAGVRTPFAQLLSAFKSLSAADLGGIAIAAPRERAGVSADNVDYLIAGQVLQTGAGQDPARTAGLKVGLPASVPSITVNKVCMSGSNAIAQADHLIRSGEAG